MIGRPLRAATDEPDCHDDRQRGDAPALIFEAEDGRVETFTFARLKALSNRFANALAAKGVGRGDRVGILLAQGPETAIAHLAIYKLGAVALPLFTLFGPEGLRSRLEDCRPRVLVTDAAHAALAEGFAGIELIVAGESLQPLLAGHPPSYRPRTSAVDMAMYQYTSGTTREMPEAVKHSHRAIVMVMIAAWWRNRSRMAVADGTSPISLPQSSSGRFEVIVVERFSYRRMITSNRYSPDRLGNCFRPMSSMMTRSGLR